MGMPILGTAVRLPAMRLGVVALQVMTQPDIRLLLRRGPVKVIQRLMSFLDGPERVLDLPLCPSGHPAAIRAGWLARVDSDGQMLHHLVKDQGAGRRTVVGMDHVWNPLQGIVLFLGHGIEQKAQGVFRIPTVDAAIGLVGEAGPVIDDAEQDQGRLAALGINPFRLLDVLEIRWAHVEMPALVAVAGLEAHDHRRPCQTLVVKSPCAQPAVRRRTRQDSGRGLNMTIRGLVVSHFAIVAMTKRGGPKAAPCGWCLLPVSSWCSPA